MQLLRRTIGSPSGHGPVCDVLGRRGSVGLIFAFTVLPLTIAMAVAVDFTRLTAARAALQRAVDTAALSGAASYTLNTAAFQTLSITTATSAFCGATAALPAGAKVVTQTGAQSCGAAAGPLVAATVDSFVTGTPGVTHAAGISCTGTYLPPAPYNCGFIVTVAASVTLTPILPALFGTSRAVSAQGMAANPFLSFAKIFSLPAGINTNAKYANSVWAYPLALNASGAIDYSGNDAALPDTSACTGGPDQVACGSYVMLASTMYGNAGTGYTPPGQTTIYDNGVVRDPVSPTFITATTPLGIAFRSIAGGNTAQYASSPGVYGYQVTNLGSSPAQYAYAPNGCIYPYNNLAYNTVGQVWKTSTTTNNGVTTTTTAPLLPWALVTHWFYSSYLLKNRPPSQPEIDAQTPNNELIPSVPNDPAQSGGNIMGKPTYNASPSPAVATTCPATTTTGNVTTSNSKFQTTTYITTGASNCSLYIDVSTSATYTAPNSSYVGSCFDPSNTPGQYYAALSCQQYNNKYYTFYWNDMGGNTSDNKNYGDGSVTVNCSGVSYVILLN